MKLHEVFILGMLLFGMLFIGSVISIATRADQPPLVAPYRGK